VTDPRQLDPDRVGKRVRQGLHRQVEIAGAAFAAEQQHRLVDLGVRPAREAIHDMWIRVTIDRSFVIHAIQAVTDGMPYPGACNRIEAAYGKLVGANLVIGFRKALHDAMGGIRGCTHLTELLGYLPTAAVQTFAGLRREAEGDERPFQLDRCHALAITTDTVRTYYAKWYKSVA